MKKKKYCPVEDKKTANILKNFIFSILKFTLLLFIVLN